MHIVVCAKQIPNPEISPSVFKLDEAAKQVVPIAGMSQVMSPFDEQALEAALRIREMVGVAKITVMSLGPSSAKDIIKHGLSLGADEGILLTDKAFERSDSYTTALALAEAIRKLGDCDLVLTGRQAADWDAGIVGCGIAELLAIPAITFAKSVRIENGAVRVERVLDDGFETVETRLPAVVTISNELGVVRKANLRETMKAARKPTHVWSSSEIGIPADRLGEAGARRVLERLFVPAKNIHCEMFNGNTPEEIATSIIRRLREVKVI